MLSAVFTAPTTVEARPTSQFDVYEKSIPELQIALTQKKVTSRQLVLAYLARIRAYDQSGPAINAIVTLNPNALAEADALDKERAERGSRSPLHGVPVLVKDNFDTVDMPTSGGSVALAGLRSTSDAFQVARLRAAGAIIIGKTTMHELATNVTTISSLTGRTRNPYDIRRSPGGSSGGTGAAIAANFAAAGLGTDTCGSLSLPASHQNLFGIRMSEGMASRAGIMPLSTTQDVPGPIARTIEDIAIMLDATVGQDKSDPSTKEGRAATTYFKDLRPGALRGARIGVVRSLFKKSPMLDSNVGKRLDEALTTLKRAGAELIDIDLSDIEGMFEGSSVIRYEFKPAFKEYLSRHPNAPVRSLDEIMVRQIGLESVIERQKSRNEPEVRDEKAYQAALEKRAAVRARLTDTMAMAGVQALAYPASLQPPMIWGGELVGSGTCMLSAQTGLPSLTVPLPLSEAALPVGMTLLGLPFDEQRLLALGYDWEKVARPRTAPIETPPLVAGKAPSPRLLLAQQRLAAGKTVSTRLRYDLLRGTLDYSARITGLAGDAPVALLIHRWSENKSPGPVVEFMLSRRSQGSGQINLEPRLQRDLLEGRLYLQLYTTQHPLGLGPINLPPAEAWSQTKEAR